MVADVPVAALLSGGIDSSLVVAAYCRVSNELPTTFNVRFPDTAYDETIRAIEVSTHFHTKHETIDFKDWTVEPESVMRLFRHFDQPFADTSLIPMYWVARAIRDRGIICALSGDAGDEAFGGYSCFWQANQLFKLMRLPSWVQTATALTARQFSNWTPDLGRQLAKALQIAQVGRKDSAILIASLANYLSEEQKNALVCSGAGMKFEPASRHFDGYNTAGAATLEELSRRLTENLFAVSLPSNMLHRADMMSMLASIEIRVPMLDEEMVAVGLRLPHALKTDGQHGKLALRSLAAKWLPRSVAAHPKHGFCIPLDRLVTDRFYEMLVDTLLAPGASIASFLNMSLVKRWLELFKQAKYSRPTGALSREGLYQRIFSVLALELWLREKRLSW
jgi:asparagine synthase (glutamine-hydrolysing)